MIFRFRTVNGVLFTSSVCAAFVVRRSIGAVLETFLRRRPKRAHAARPQLHQSLLENADSRRPLYGLLVVVEAAAGTIACLHEAFF